MSAQHGSERGEWLASDAGATKYADCERCGDRVAESSLAQMRQCACCADCQPLQADLEADLGADTACGGDGLKSEYEPFDVIAEVMAHFIDTFGRAKGAF